MEGAVGSRKRRKLSAPQAAPYVLHQLIDNVPIQPESNESGVHITCVEYWSAYSASASFIPRYSRWNKPLTLRGRRQSLYRHLRGRDSTFRVIAI